MEMTDDVTVPKPQCNYRSNLDKNRIIQLCFPLLTQLYYYQWS